MATQVGERGIRRASLTSILERTVDPSISVDATLVPRTEPQKPAAPPPPAATAAIHPPVNPKGSASGETEAEEKCDVDEDDTGPSCFNRAPECSKRPRRSRRGSEIQVRGLAG